MIINKNEVKNLIKNKRIGSIDFGLRRIGLAVCDEFHICPSPRDTFDNEGEASQIKILDFFKEEKIEFIVIGFPDTSRNQAGEHIKEFAEKLSILTELPIYLHDESFSSKKAVSVMLEIGKKKKFRKEKGNTDRIAAAIILQDFLNEFE